MLPRSLIQKNVRRALRLGAIAGLLLTVRLMTAAESVTLHSLDEPDPGRDERVAWHTLARFGCFIHWGVYSDLGGEWPGAKPGTYSEHVMRWAKIPRAVYLDKVARPFNPTKFDADAWVRLLRDTGMRYLVITAKHHDGFAMYPSKVSDFNLSITAFQRDPMRELREACTKYGLKFGFYYSHAFDWEHPDAPGNDWDYENPGGDKLIGGRDWWETRPDFLPRAKHYVDTKAIPQIQELIRNYHPDIMWFDTPHKLPPDENRRILAAVRTADPHVVVNGRLIANFGDYKNTADRPAEVPYVSGNWEGIPTTNDSYGWSRVDHGHKPPEHFIQLLAKTVSKGGNMLLNVGPMGTGEIDPKDVSILEGIGRWMRVNAESIRGCGRTPLAVQSWGTSTAKPNRLYLHVFRWPTDGHLVVGGLRSTPTGARVLAAGLDPGETTTPNGATASASSKATSAADAGALQFSRRNVDDLQIDVPNVAVDTADTVIELTFAGEVITNPARLIPPSEVTTLHVMDGKLTGGGIRFADGKRNNDCTIEWTDVASGVDWPVRITQPGRYRVAVNYATTTKDNAGKFVISFGGKTLAGSVTPTEKISSFATQPVGEVELLPGDFTLSIRPTEISANRDLMRLRTIELTPVPSK